jgi:hypothetical protein
MSINKSILIGLIGSSLLLTGCGGGGSTAVIPTVIDGYNMTEGTKDTKQGATYVQEFLTEVGSSTTVSTMYTRLDVPGVKQAHLDGWTGKDKTITVLDSDFSTGAHGRTVSDIARIVAPGATRNEYLLGSLTDSAKNIATMASDVITTSSGYTPFALTASPVTATYVDDLISDAEASAALITVAAQHSNWTGDRADSPEITGRGGFTTCPNDATMTVASCNSWSIQGLNSSNVIYVGEINSNNSIPSWSNQAGDANKDRFIVASSDVMTSVSDGEPDGNSYAAPRAAGVGALIRHKFPNLNGSQAATVILHTADDLGATGVDEVYGHGKLNAGAALAPIGNLH